MLFIFHIQTKTRFTLTSDVLFLYITRLNHITTIKRMHQGGNYFTTNKMRAAPQNMIENTPKAVVKSYTFPFVSLTWSHKHARTRHTAVPVTLFFLTTPNDHDTITPCTNTPTRYLHNTHTHTPPHTHPSPTSWDSWHIHHTPPTHTHTPHPIFPHTPTKVHIPHTRTP